MKRKLLAILLILAMALPMTGCGGEEPEPEYVPTVVEEEPEEEEPEVEMIEVEEIEEPEEPEEEPYQLAYFNGLEFYVPNPWEISTNDSSITMSNILDEDDGVRIVGREMGGSTAFTLELNFLMVIGGISTADTVSLFEEGNVTVSGQPAKVLTYVQNLGDGKMLNIIGFLFPVEDSVFFLQMAMPIETDYLEELVEIFYELVNSIELPAHEFLEE